jgi:Tol biopolymer transport system component
VAPFSGRLAIMDFQSGCTTNRGLYIANKDGGQIKLLLDMKNDQNWGDPGEVFWSPDESKIAVEATYGFNVCFFIINAQNGVSLGYICAPNSNLNIHNTTLYGWSPDGQWLLYSQYLNNPAQSYLFKVRVTSQGDIDQKSVTTLLANVAISGATWGRIAN